MSEIIVNRVASSPLISLDLADFVVAGKRTFFDLKDCLYEGLILREKDFREFIKTHNWSQYQDHHVAIGCTADAIVPMWAFMLAAAQIQPYAATIVYGNLDDLEKEIIRNALSKIVISEFAGKKIVVKGCSNLAAPEFTFVEITRLLRPVVSSLMFGEPCSTVPIFKQK